MIDSVQSPKSQTQTTRQPIRRRSPSASSDAPMIIDISLDQSGKQVYQLNTIKRNTFSPINNNNEDNDDSDDDDDDEHDGNNNNNKKRDASAMQGEDEIDASSSRAFKKLKAEAKAEAQNVDPEDVWCTDVENAFREALEIIPKQGLHKIKISGRACGRNELISDFILTQTGKFRSRKQVSSHIQVLKNLGKDKHLIDLILTGPEQDAKSERKFNEVFSRISFNKSIGQVSAADGGCVEGTICSDDIEQPKRRSSRQHSKTQNRQFQSVTMEQLQKIEIGLLNFKMIQNIHEGSNTSQRTISRLPSGKFYDKTMRIRSNADLSHRFPEFFKLVDSIKSAVPSTTTPETVSIPSSIPPIPILHGMVKLLPPSLLDQNQGEYNVTANLKLSGLPITDDTHYCCLTKVYNFGKPGLSTFEKIDARLNKEQQYLEFDLRLGTDYWNTLFKHLKSVLLNNTKDGEDSSAIESKLLTKGIKSVSMKQIVFNVSSKEYRSPVGEQFGIDDIDKRSIRAVLIWEFLKVDNEEDALTTMREIHIPFAGEPDQKLVAQVHPQQLHPYPQPPKPQQQQQQQQQQHSQRSASLNIDVSPPQSLSSTMSSPINHTAPMVVARQFSTASEPIPQHTQEYIPHHHLSQPVHSSQMAVSSSPSEDLYQQQHTSSIPSPLQSTANAIGHPTLNLNETIAFGSVSSASTSALSQHPSSASSATTAQTSMFDDDDYQLCGMNPTTIVPGPGAVGQNMAGLDMNVGLDTVGFGCGVPDAFGEEDMVGFFPVGNTNDSAITYDSNTVANNNNSTPNINNANTGSTENGLWFDDSNYMI
ncbi:unnamed protein product [Ambrosiozyma monospora]|uniref:Unnamed protein product n=1 Tax=Ambrosiozyma monospora TaxID=43982 RepID=A0ACB5SUL3_AMBMO|nr:unnamed protein product [Ambrosiozyma monospora]